MTQAKLAEHLCLTEATISRHVRTLVTKELLIKKKDAVNKKSSTLSLTELGVATFLTAKKSIMLELDTLFSHITEEDKKIITKNFMTTITTLHQKK